MHNLPNTIIGVFLLGSGVIGLALVTGSSPVFAVLLLVAAASQLIFAVVNLIRQSTPLKYAILTGLVLPIFYLIGCLTQTQWRLLPLLVSSGFSIAATGVNLFVTYRHTQKVVRPIATGSYLAVTAAITAVVSLLATPALAATPAGDYAHSHGMHMGNMGAIASTNVNGRSVLEVDELG